MARVSGRKRTNQPTNESASEPANGFFHSFLTTIHPSFFWFLSFLAVGVAECDVWQIPRWTPLLCQAMPRSSHYHSEWNLRRTKLSQRLFVCRSLVFGMRLECVLFLRCQSTNDEGGTESRKRPNRRTRRQVYIVF